MATHDLKEFIHPLAERIARQQFIPFVAAGLSVSWGNQTAGNLASTLFERFQRVATGSPEVDEVADQIGATRAAAGKPYFTDQFGPLNEVLSERLGKKRYLSCVWKLGAPAARRWPWITLEEGAELYQAGFPVIGDPHLMIGRLAREGVVREVITPNFDTLIEIGCWATGMLRPAPEGGYRSTESFHVIADQKDFISSTPYRNELRIVKIHGCVGNTIDRLSHGGSACCCAEVNPAAPPGLKDELPSERVGPCRLWSQDDFEPRHNFVMTYRELLHWRQDTWARDLLADRLRNHNMLFMGFSGVDAVLHSTMRSIADEVTNALEQAGEDRPARLFAVDRSPQFTLQRLTATKDEKASPLLHVDGWISGRDTRSDLELVAQMTYGRTMIHLLKRMLETEGSTWAQQTLPPTEWSCANTHLQHLIQWVTALDPVMVEGHRSLLWRGISGAVAASWRCQTSAMEFRFRPDRLPVNVPDHYIPLSKNPALTIPVLRFYQLLDQVHDKRVHYHPGGWALVEGERQRHAVIPVLLSERHRGPAMSVIDPHLLSMAPPVPQKPVVILITPDEVAAVKDVAMDNATFGNLTSQLSRSFTTRVVPLSRLWSEDPVGSLLGQLFGGAR